VTAEEFDAFYAGSVDRLVGQVYALTGDRGEAQDAVQEAFIRAWKHRGSLERDGHPEAWVRKVAMRLAISRWRKAQTALTSWRRHGVDDDSAGPSPDNVAVIDALRQISDEQRRAIVLHHLCDLSVEQVALETGAPTGTVKARLARGRAALAVLLSDTDPTEATHG
jgi:RNA polymerase sigma-70 factor (ECF subfamily)